MTRQNADNAGEADILMTETNRVVEEANNSMGELTQSMEAIVGASEDIVNYPNSPASLRILMRVSFERRKFSF